MFLCYFHVKNILIADGKFFTNMMDDIKENNLIYYDIKVMVILACFCEQVNRTRKG